MHNQIEVSGVIILVSFGDAIIGPYDSCPGYLLVGLLTGKLLDHLMLVAEVLVNCGSVWCMMQVQAKTVSPVQSVLIVQAGSKELQTLSGFFSRLNWQVWLAANGAEAQALLQQHAPALLVLDLHLPDSLDVLRQTRQQLPQTKVIVTNKHPDLRREMQAKEQGVYVFLRQPFTREWIEKSLARLSEEPSARPAARQTALPKVSIPISLKISAPYVGLALLFVVTSAWLLGRYLLETFQERFNQQVVTAVLAADDRMVAEENALLTELRALAHTAGVPAAIAQRDADTLRALTFPSVLNAGAESVVFFDRVGEGVLVMHLADPEKSAYSFVTYEPSYMTQTLVSKVLLASSDEQGDKYAALMTVPQGQYFYVGGPVFNDAREVVGGVLVGMALPTLANRLRETNAEGRVALYSPQGEMLAVSGLGDTVPLSPALAQEVLAQKTTTGYLRAFRIGAVPYGEALGPWQARNSTEVLGVLGVAFIEQDFANPNPWLQAQVYGLVAVGVIGVVGLGIFLAGHFTRPLRDMVSASSQVARGNLEVKVSTQGDDETAVLAHAFNFMVSELQEGSIYRDLLGRTVSPEVRQALRSAFASGDLRLEGQNMTATVLMSDIWNFTTLSEKEDPVVVLTWLNEYFGELVPLVTAEGGVVDKFEGDALLVFFGILPTPSSPLASAYAACRAALTMIAAVEELNEQRVQRGQPQLLTGIGINTGPVTAGGLGTADRLNYTIIGDTVNTAQRLERHTRILASSGIIISQETYDVLAERRAEFAIEPLGGQLFKGKTETVAIYHLRGLANAPIVTQRPAETTGQDEHADPSG